MRGRIFQGPDAQIPDLVYDYGIVGAGIFGLALACFLAREGKRVIVLEENTIPGEGITVNTSGILRTCYSDPDVMAMAAFSLPYFTHPMRLLNLKEPLHTGFVRTGWGRFINAEANPGAYEGTRLIEAEAARLGLRGVRVQTIGEHLKGLPAARAENLRRIFDLEDVTHVLVDEHGGHADGGATLLAFFRAGLEQGVHFSLYSTVTGFQREGRAITGAILDRWRSRPLPAGGTVREVLRTEEVRLARTVIAAGLGSRRLLEALDLQVPFFLIHCQTPYARSIAHFPWALEQHPRPAEGKADGLPSPIQLASLPAISHWRDFYFRPEGPGVLIGIHERTLYDEGYLPQGGKLSLGDTSMRVGVAQPLLDRLIAHLDRFPIFGSPGLNLGRRPEDVPGGFYVINPEELPFEGEIPRTEETLFFIGSGSGTGFKLGPGVAYLLYQRLMGIPREERGIASPALSAERARYFYPRETSHAYLRGLFDGTSEGGRFKQMGASGIAPKR